MKKQNKTNSDPINKAVQANKDEAESMLRVWGMKERKHLKPNNNVGK